MYWPEYKDIKLTDCSTKKCTQITYNYDVDQVVATESQQTFLSCTWRLNLGCCLDSGLILSTPEWPDTRHHIVYGMYGMYGMYTVLTNNLKVLISLGQCRLNWSDMIITSNCTSYWEIIKLKQLLSKICSVYCVMEVIMYKS